jgi:hypothetical protein
MVQHDDLNNAVTFFNRSARLAKRALVIQLTPQTHPNLWECVLRGEDSDLFTMAVRSH